MTYIFLDDIRNPQECHYTSNPRFYYLNDWIIVRDFKQFCTKIEELFAKGSWPITVSLDHDLADKHYLDSGIEADQYDEYYVGLPEKTGLDCAKWLADFCLANNLELPECHIHSMNTVGAENIKSFLNSFKKFQKDPKL